MSALKVKTSKLSCGCIIQSEHPPKVETIILCPQHSKDLIETIIKIFAKKLVDRVKVGKVSFRIESSDWIVEATERKHSEESVDQ